MTGKDYSGNEDYVSVTEVEEYKGVKIGITADEVLEILGNNATPEVLGKDEDGLIVEWHYNDVIITLAYATQISLTLGNISAYAVQKIEVIDE